mgnify:CR=1 FL=1
MLNTGTAQTPKQNTHPHTILVELQEILPQLRIVGLALDGAVPGRSALQQVPPHSHGAEAVEAAS